MRKHGFVKPLSRLLLIIAAFGASQAFAGSPGCVHTANGWQGPEGFCLMFGDTSGNALGIPIVFHAGAWSTDNDTFQFGAPNDRPVVGDWDGDGEVSPALLTSSGWLVTNQSNGTAPFAIDAQGLTGAPVSGDWDGDGKETLGHYMDGTWVLSNTDAITASSTGMSTFTVQFGAPNMRPLVGDWNDDGISDFGVYDGVSFYLSVGPTPDLSSAQVITPNPQLPDAIPVAGHFHDNPGFVGLMLFVPQEVTPPPGVVIELQVPGDMGGSGDSIDIIEVQ